MPHGGMPAVSTHYTGAFARRCIKKEIFINLLYPVSQTASSAQALRLGQILRPAAAGRVFLHTCPGHAASGSYSPLLPHHRFFTHTSGTCGEKSSEGRIVLRAACLQRLCRRLRCRRLGFYMHEAPSAEEGAVQCYSSHSHALSHTHSPLSPSTHWPSSSPKRKSSSSKNHSSSQTSALPSVITSQQR